MLLFLHEAARYQQKMQPICILFLILVLVSQFFLFNYITFFYMPSNKNASYRYRLINHCLSQRGKQWTFKGLQQHMSDQLQEVFNVELNESGQAISERQLSEDIAIMRRDPPEGYAAPIVRKQGLVYYDDPSYSMQKSPLSNSDLEAMQEASALLRQFSVFPHYRELTELIHKFKEQISHFELQSKAGEFVQFEKNEKLKGTEWLAPLYESIKNKQPLFLHYRPFEPDTPIRTIFCPYLLKEYNNRWFLLGWDQKEQAIRNYALDRIAGIEQTNTPWYQDDNFDAVSFFADVYGVTVLEGVDVEQILLEVTPSQANYIKTKPIHNSQQLSGPKDGVFTVSLRLRPNYELESLLLSFGEKVKVLRPDGLRDKIRDRIRKANERYHS